MSQLSVNLYSLATVIPDFVGTVVRDVMRDSQYNLIGVLLANERRLYVRCLLFLCCIVDLALESFANILLPSQNRQLSSVSRS